MFFRKKSVPPLIVPEPGQQVRLLGWGASGRAEVRAVSEPFTNARGEVVIRVTEESEYQDALREGRAAIGIPWPARHMVVVVPPLETLEAPHSAGEGPAGTSEGESQTASSRPQEQRRSWWRRFFGIE